MEDLIVWTIVAAVALCALYRLVRRSSPERESSCGTQCAGCSCSGGRTTGIRDPKEG